MPPDVAGRIEWIAAPGKFTDDATVLRVLDATGKTHDVALSHFWPVRTPRPARERLASDEPLVTGQRILDSLFPVALGGKAAIRGGFVTGKTILLESLAKGCSADVIVYLGCGERGNEMAGVLEEFPQLIDPRTGRSLMERTVIIANTSNMPVAAREASIYSAVTVAEYFRDQGLHVALMADSTSRWAEALREVSGRFGELPGEGGYPTYLSSRLADFYERAAKVTTLNGDSGSVTVLASISPPSGDFSEPVTSHSKRYVRSYWALDARRAQARFYPAINPLLSYSEDALDVAGWWLGRYGAVPTARARGLRRKRVARTAPPGFDTARRAGAAGAHGAHHRQGCAAGPPAADADVRRAGQRCVPAPVCVFRDRSLLRAGAASGDAPPARALHRTRGIGRRGRRRAGADRRARRHAAARTHGRGHRRGTARAARRTGTTGRTRVLDAGGRQHA
jgi:hypothetical protein